MKEFVVGIVIGSAVNATIGTAFRTVNERIAQVGQTVKQLNDRKLNLESQLARSIEIARQTSTALLRVAHDTRDIKLEETFAKSQAEAFRLARQINKVGEAMEKVAGYKQILEKNQTYRQQYKADLMGTIAMGAAIVAPFKVAVDYESAKMEIGRLMKFTTAQEMAFGQSLLNKSRIMPIGVDDLAKIALVGAHIKEARPELGKFTDMAVKFSVVFKMMPEEAARSMGEVMNIYRASINETQNLGDAITFLSYNMAADATGVFEVVTRSAGAAQMVGLTAKQLAALGATLMSLGRGPEEASATLGIMLQRLSAADVMSEDFQRSLGMAGINSMEFGRKLKNNAQGALMELLEGLKRLDKQRQNEALYQMFGRSSREVARLIEHLDDYKKALRNVEDQANYTGMTQEMYEKILKSNAIRLQQVENATKGVASSIGAMFLPALSTMLIYTAKGIGWVGEFTEKHEWLIQILGGAILGFVGLGIVLKAGRFGVTYFTDAYAILGTIIEEITSGMARLRMQIIWETVAKKASAVWNYVLAASEWVGTAATTAYTAAVGGLKWAWAKAIVVGKIFNATVLANPITWIVVGVIALGVALYEVIKHWDAINAKIKEWTGIDLSAAGRRIIGSLWEGMKSFAHKPIEVIGSVVQKIRDYLPFSPAKEGPLRDLHRVNIMGTIADTIKPGPVQAALSRALQIGGLVAAMSPLGMTISAAGGETPPLREGFKIEVTQNFYINGPVDDSMKGQIAGAAGSAAEDGISKAIREFFKHEARIDWGKAGEKNE